jgi:hypothetical protein
VPALIVHPAADLAYASFVLEGFATLLGPDAIRYATDGFPRRYTGGRVLAMYRADDPSARCFLSFHDHPRVNEMGMEWARVVGMVNVDDADVGRGDKVIAIGPTFGVRLRARAVTLRHVRATLRWNGWRGTRDSLTRLRAVAAHERKRATIDRYVPRASDPGYVFFTAWPWSKHPEVNPPRAAFVEACLRAPGLTFEGGFAPRRRRDLPELAALSAPRRYPIGEYLEKLGRSAVAFNNPAVHGCHGWKLGEFLALGKAIVTLPLTRALPAPLEDGVHVHVVDGSPASLDAALERLRRDHDYRRALEANARRWYDEHLAPPRVAQRLLARMG